MSVPREIDPLMGWTGTRDMRAEVQLAFDSNSSATSPESLGALMVVLRSHSRLSSLPATKTRFSKVVWAGSASTTRSKAQP